MSSAQRRSTYWRETSKVNSLQSPSIYSGDYQFDLGKLGANQCVTGSFAAGTAGNGKAFTEDLRVCREGGLVVVRKDTYIDGVYTGTSEPHCRGAL